MADDNNVVIGVSLDDQASDPLDQLAGKVENLGTKTEDSMGKSEEASGSFFNAAIAGSVAAGEAIFAFAQDVLQMGEDVIQNVEALQTLDVSLTQLTGSAATAQGVLKQMDAFANSSPFGIGAIEAATNRLVLMGISAQQAVPLLSVLGNTAAAMGGDLDNNLTRLANFVARIAETGKVSTLNLTMAVRQGIPIYSLLAQSLGVSDAAVQKMATDGKITSAVLLKAFADAGGAGGKFATAMTQQSTTLGGAWTRLTNVFDTATNSGVKPLADALGVILYGATNVLIGVLDALGVVLQGIEGVFISVSNVIRQAWNQNMLGIQTITKGIFGEIMDGLSIVVNFFVDQIDVLIDAYDKVAAVLHLGPISKIAHVDIAASVASAFASITSDIGDFNVQSALSGVAGTAAAGGAASTKQTPEEKAAKAQAAKDAKAVTDNIADLKKTADDAEAKRQKNLTTINQLQDKVNALKGGAGDQEVRTEALKQMTDLEAQNTDLAGKVANAVGDLSRSSTQDAVDAITQIQGLVASGIQTDQTKQLLGSLTDQATLDKLQTARNKKAAAANKRATTSTAVSAPSPVIDTSPSPTITADAIMAAISPSATPAPAATVPGLSTGAVVLLDQGSVQTKNYNFYIQDNQILSGSPNEVAQQIGDALLQYLTPNLKFASA